MNNVPWKIVAKNAPHSSTVTTLAAVRVRRRNTAAARAVDGPRLDRDEGDEHAAPPARNACVAGDVQPISTLRLIAYTIAINPAVTVTAPATSRRRVPAARRRGTYAGRADEHDADGHVDEEDPLPARALGEHPAGDHADRPGAAADGAEDPERLVARPFGERAGEDGQRRRRRQRRPDALHPRGRDERSERAGQPRGERRRGEQREPGDEHRGGARTGRRPGRRGAGTRRASARR